MLSLPSGWYAGSQVTAVSSPNSTVYYTLNGDQPNQSDPVFPDSIAVSQTMSVSAKAFSSLNYLPSRVVDRTYIIDEDNHELPVISIHTDSVNLWDFNEGIYVLGPNASTDYPYFGSNFWQPWSKYSRLEVFGGDQQKLAEEHFDLEIHGGWSRGENQKSLRCDFKSRYTGKLEVPVFSQKPEILDFNNINLRNGGQHMHNSIFHDGLLSRVVNETHVDNMAYEPSILYLNGEYWGLHGIREKLDEHTIESTHGVPAESIDLLNANYALTGSQSHFFATHEALTNLSPTDPTFYALADSRIDLENYVDYFIIQTFIQNKDWIGVDWGINNIKLWRPQTETGKWRYMLYDTDGAMGTFGGDIWEDYIFIARNPSFPSEHSELFDQLLDNETFKCQFAKPLRRLAQHDFFIR